MCASMITACRCKSFNQNEIKSEVVLRSSISYLSDWTLRAVLSRQQCRHRQQYISFTADKIIIFNRGLAVSMQCYRHPVFRQTFSRSNLMFQLHPFLYLCLPLTLPSSLLHIYSHCHCQVKPFSVCRKSHGLAEFKHCQQLRRRTEKGWDGIVDHSVAKCKIRSLCMVTSVP